MDLLLWVVDITVFIIALAVIVASVEMIISDRVVVMQTCPATPLYPTWDACRPSRNFDCRDLHSQTGNLARTYAFLSSERHKVPFWWFRYGETNTVFHRARGKRCKRHAESREWTLHSRFTCRSSTSLMEKKNLSFVKRRGRLRMTKRVSASIQSTFPRSGSRDDSWTVFSCWTVDVWTSRGRAESVRLIRNSCANPCRTDSKSVLAM